MGANGGTSIRDVARHANVSTATVSRVLNNPSLVRPETVAQVQAVIKKLGYTPPAVRRGPKVGSRRSTRMRSIAFFSLGQPYRGWFAMPVMAAVIGAATEAAKRHNWNVILDEMPDARQEAPLLRGGQIDGAVIFVSSALARSNELVEVMDRIRGHTAVVWAMGFSTVPVPVDHVTANNLGIGYLAQRYLTERGCKRLAFIATQPDWPIIRWRWRAFADFLPEVQTFGISENPDDLRPYGNQTVCCRNIQDLADKLVSAQPRPDGLFIPLGSDASELYPLLKERGLEPEKDIRIVCCDAEQVRVSHLTPRPAVVDLRTDQIGYRTIRQLLHRISHPNEPAVLVEVMPRLILPEDPLLPSGSETDHSVGAV